jgi:hypothetical protein
MTSTPALTGKDQPAEIGDANWRARKLNVIKTPTAVYVTLVKSDFDSIHFDFDLPARYMHAL